MKIRRYLPHLLGLVLSVSVLNVNAEVIDFDDLTGQSSFTDAGIQGSYIGYEWGSNNLTNIPQVGTQGWGYSSGNVGGRTALSGTSFAWTYSGSQSHFIDFQGPVDFNSGMFAATSFGNSNDATTIQMFGYDASDTLIASSGILNLTTAYQQLSSPTLTGITTLEIRSNSQGRWFVMDDLTLNTSVPAPASLGLLILAMLGMGARRLSRNQ